MESLGNYLAAFDPERHAFSVEEREFMAQHRVELESAVTRTVAYVVYENRFGRAGGIFPVALSATGELSHRQSVLVISPYHRNLKRAPDLPCTHKVHVPFGGSSIEVSVLEHVEANGVVWYLLGAEGFFDASGGADGTDPYAHSGPTKLLIDSLLFCQAVPRVLQALGVTHNVVVHAQDWEAASTALTVREAVLSRVLKSATVTLTLHNSYDHGVGEELSLITSRSLRVPGLPPTILGCMLPLLAGPLSTVSAEFARELTHDPLQTAVFAPHLQPLLRSMPIVGISNGFFGRDAEPFSVPAIRAAVRGSPARILAEKAERRYGLLAWLETFKDPRQLGGLWAIGDERLTELDPRVPIFCMFGRLDPNQKGFDLVLRAIETWPRGSAKFILMPNVGGAPEPYVRDFAEVAEQRAGDLLVFPFRMSEGYREIVAGSSFVVFPSLFEPFGGVSEAYFSGTPVLARATGGLISQVVDVDEAPDHATGILFRESLGLGAEHDLKQMQMATQPRSRQSLASYRKMVQALSAGLERATTCFQQGSTYALMLSRLGRKARSFSWESTVRGYEALYDLSTL